MSELPLSEVAAGAGDDARFNGAALELLRRLGRDGLVVRMIDLFLETAVERLTAIRDGVAAGDLTTVQLAAHSLKSSAAQLGGEALRHVSAALEADAEAGRLDAVATGAVAVEAEFGPLRSWLEAAKAASGDSSSTRGINPS